MERGHQILEFVLPLGDVCCDLAVPAFLRGALRNLLPQAGTRSIGQRQNGRRL